MASIKARKTIGKLGADLRQGRLRRRMSIADLASRAGTSQSTISRLENGDTGIRIGVLADVLLALGAISRLDVLMDLAHDDIGQMMSLEQLPKRGRSGKAILKASKKKQSKLESKSSQNSDGKKKQQAAQKVDSDGIGF